MKGGETPMKKRYLLLLLLLSGCCQFKATDMGILLVPTGFYRLYQASQCTVQNVYEANGGDPRLIVDACILTKKKEIWFSSGHGLQAEIKKVQSEEALIEGYRQDLEWLKGAEE